MNERPIGIFDSGLGGLTVLDAIAKCHTNRSLIYFGDTARVPYGCKSAKTVTQYALEIGYFLESLHVKEIIVACNTASAIALSTLQRELSVPVIGVIEPGAQAAVAATENGKIGVIGTKATIRSGCYPRAIAELSSASVITAPCPLFVPFVEEGLIAHPALELMAREYLAPFIEAGVDTLLLGCTHYPILKELIQRIIGEAVALIDSGQSVAERISPTSGSTAEYLSYVSDDPEAFQRQACRFIQTKITHVHHQPHLELPCSV